MFKIMSVNNYAHKLKDSWTFMVVKLWDPQQVYLQQNFTYVILYNF